MRHYFLSHLAKFIKGLACNLMERSARQTGLHQIMTEFTKMQQLFSVVLKAEWNQLRLQTDGKHSLHG